MNEITTFLSIIGKDTKPSEFLVWNEDSKREFMDDLVRGELPPTSLIGTALGWFLAIYFLAHDSSIANLVHDLFFLSSFQICLNLEPELVEKQVLVDAT